MRLLQRTTRRDVGAVLAVAACLAGCAADEPIDQPTGVWRTPQRLGESVLLDSFEGTGRPLAALARDGSGAYCIWLSRQGFDTVALASWDPTRGWVPRPGVVGQDFPTETAIAAGAGGRGVALWLSSAGIVDGTSQNGVLVHRLGPGTEQASAELIDRYSAQLARYFNPSANVVMNESGNAVGAWLSGDTLWGSTRPRDTGWSAREPIAVAERTDSFGTDLYSPRLAIDRSGALFVAWQSKIGLRAGGPLTGEIVVRRRSPDGRWDPPHKVGNTFYQTAVPNTAVDDDGNAMVLWSISNAAEGTLWAAHFDRQQGWSEARRIAIVPHRAELTSSRLAMTRDGRAVAVWAVNDGNQYRILAFRYDRAGGWSSAEEIAVAGSDGRMPTVAAGGNGEFTAIWVERTGATTTNLWSNHFDGTRWGSPERLPTTEPATIWYPEVAMDDRGNAMAVWTESTAMAAGSLYASYWAARR